MKVIEALQQGRPTLSFEFYPPKTEEQEKQLFAVIEELKQFKPDFVSITYGAMGKTRDKTFYWAERIKKLGLEPVVHLTLISFSAEAAITRELDKLKNLKVDNILALRGDPPEHDPEFFKNSRWGQSYAKDLVHFIKYYAEQICVGVAGYPEKHPAAPSLAADIQHLKEKITAGAEYIVSQLFFNNQYYFTYVDRCRQAGIKAPIIPGIMPITSLGQIRKMTKICGATIPDGLIKRLETVEENKEAVEAIGVDYAIKQSRELLNQGVPGLHFFVLNQSGPISQILKELKAFRR
jgi:methylenetetrahydrofolate reductase (NADPH)